MSVMRFLRGYCYISYFKGRYRMEGFEDILKTEYSERFDELRKKAMCNSYYKYGSVKENYESYKCMDSIGNLKKRLEAYEKTGNTEFLVDVANFAMIEFMYPQKEGAKYIPTGTGVVETVGFGVKQVKDESNGL